MCISCVESGLPRRPLGALPLLQLSQWRVAHCCPNDDKRYRASAVSYGGQAERPGSSQEGRGPRQAGHAQQGLRERPNLACGTHHLLTLWPIPRPHAASRAAGPFSSNFTWRAATRDACRAPEPQQSPSRHSPVAFRGGWAAGLGAEGPGGSTARTAPAAACGAPWRTQGAPVTMRGKSLGGGDALVRSPSGRSPSKSASPVRPCKEEELEALPDRRLHFSRSVTLVRRVWASGRRRLPPAPPPPQGPLPLLAHASPPPLPCLPQHLHAVVRLLDLLHVRPHGRRSHARVLHAGLSVG